jgi:hypothetical protein
MKKLSYTKGLVKRAATAKTEHFDPSFKPSGKKPVKVELRVIAEQVAASMAIEDRAVQPEQIVVKSTVESRKAVADVLLIRARDRDHRQPPGDTSVGS